MDNGTIVCDNNVNRIYRSLYPWIQFTITYEVELKKLKDTVWRKRNNDQQNEFFPRLGRLFVDNNILQRFCR